MVTWETGLKKVSWELAEVLYLSLGFQMGE
jgi:hypothetical protein